LLALQAAAQTPVPLDFDLARIRQLDADLRSVPDRGCEPGADGIIVVCGRRPAPAGYPIERMAREFAVRPPVAEMSLGGNVRGRVFLEQVAMPGGAVSNRIMFGIRMPF
jgi:hypothetical protein